MCSVETRDFHVGDIPVRGEGVVQKRRSRKVSEIKDLLEAEKKKKKKKQESKVSAKKTDQVSCVSLMSQPICAQNREIHHLSEVEFKATLTELK